MNTARNVLGGPLKECCSNPMTGFFRDGFCNTCEEDVGSHTVCVEVTDRFLAYSKLAGNDLSSSHPAYNFPGLTPGDRWCLCAARWLEAYAAGMAPPVILASTHERALEVIPVALLQKHATA